MVSIFDYFSYHEFLKDWIEEKRQDNASFSQRAFLRNVGISSPAVLQRTLKGSSLSQKYDQIFAKAMSLNKTETTYWIKLIEYGNSKSIPERARIFADLLSKRSIFPQYCIDDNLLKFFKLWYYPVVREIIHILNGKEDYNKISRMVIPSITTIQAQSAVKFLEENGFLKRDKSGLLSQANPFFSTGGARHSGLLSAYHLKNLEINTSVVADIQDDKVAMSSLTLSLSSETYDQMRKELAEFRNRMLELARKETNANQVFHLNFTFLPRSREASEKEDS